MSLKDIKKQVIDTMEFMFVVDEDGVKQPIFTGETGATSLEVTSDKLEIFSGIGEVKRFELFTKKQMTFKATIKSFDLDIISRKFGVALDELSKGAYLLNKQVPLGDGKTVTLDLVRVIGVQNDAGESLRVISTGEPQEGEVLVTKANGNTTLKVATEYSYSNIRLTAEIIAEQEGDSVVISLDYTSLPSNGELVARTIVYDQAKSKVLGDFIVDFYQVQLDPNMTLSFDVSSPTEVECNFTVIAPETLPDGTYNEKKEVGKMTIQKRGLTKNPITTP